MNDRGLYKSIDGGINWSLILYIDENTGIIDLDIDPNNFNIQFASSWQKSRKAWDFKGNGDKSGIYKSNDSGNSWNLVSTMSPFNSNVIYAALEFDRTKGGVYMTTNGGESWSKQSNAVSGGTGPHYYQEIIASPHHEGTIFFMNNSALISKDHGKTFTNMSRSNQ